MVTYGKCASCGANLVGGHKCPPTLQSEGKGMVDDASVLRIKIKGLERRVRERDRIIEQLTGVVRVTREMLAVAEVDMKAMAGAVSGMRGYMADKGVEDIVVYPATDDLETFICTPLDYDVMSFTCPKCGKTRIHSRGDGYRDSLCKMGCWPQGYIVAERKCV